MKTVSDHADHAEIICSAHPPLSCDTNRWLYLFRRYIY